CIKVVLIVACPSRSAMAFGLVPDDINIEPTVCLADFGESDIGNPAAFKIRLQSLRSVQCANGEPSVSAKIKPKSCHSLPAFNLASFCDRRCAFRTATSAGVSGRVRRLDLVLGVLRYHGSSFGSAFRSVGVRHTIF